MRNRNRASKSKRGKNAHNAGAFGSQVGLTKIRAARDADLKRREEERRKEIRNAKRRAAYRAKKEAEKMKESEK